VRVDPADIEKRFVKWKECVSFAQIKKVESNKWQEASRFLTAALPASRD